MSPVKRPSIPAPVRREVFAEGPCVYCGDPADHIDHVRPIVYGGTNDLANLVPACRACNASKSGELLTNWFLYAGAGRMARALTSPKVAAEYQKLIVDGMPRRVAPGQPPHGFPNGYPHRRCPGCGGSLRRYGRRVNHVCEHHLSP